MINWILQELEKNPTSLFYKKDLISKSKKQFEELESQGLLIYSQPARYYETYPCNQTCSEACNMEVIENNGSLYAICPKDTEVDRIPLDKDDISRYKFSFDVLAETICEGNSFTGDSYFLSSRLYLIGGHVVEGINTAFVMAFYPDTQFAEPEIFSLAALVPAIYKQTVVVTPSLNLTRGDIYSKLKAASIHPTILPSSFGKNSFKIEYRANLGNRITPRGSSIPEPTEKQLAECEEHGYKCFYDRLHVPGTVPMKRRNGILINGHEIQMPDKPFALLMEMVVELKKGKGGWLHKYTEIGKYQVWERLRKPIEGSLEGKDAKKYIENDGSKGYRISTHPDFITYDRKYLINHPDPEIQRMSIALK